MKADAFDPQVLAKALQQPLPGVEAQLQLAHPARRLVPAPETTPREAGVLVLLYPDADELHFPLIARASHNPRDRHRGQISLPGGKYEEDDENLIATALREADEEVGVDPSSVEVLGTLSTLYIPVSNFNVTPVIGIAHQRPGFRAQESEVARILPTRVGELRREVRHTTRPLGNGVTLRQVPYFDLSGEVVWGATAMILSELRQVMGLLD